MKNRLITFILFVLICLPMSFLAVDAAKVNSDTALMHLALKPAANSVDPLGVSCESSPVKTVVYAGQLQSLEVPSQAEPNQLFTITARIQNTGNVPWYSSNSGCTGQTATFLGTTREQDRDTPFFAPAVFGDTKWYSGNRIIMTTPRVDPGQTGVFTFMAHAPQESGLYREYFSPVIEGKAWIKDKAELTFDIQVGQLPEGYDKVLNYTKDLKTSLNLIDPQFFGGEKRIEVSLSKQTMNVYLGDKIIRTFRVSTGAPGHPTPIGTTHIQFKQEVRVAGSSPHYIMPKFMQFRTGGYGIHALPSLGNDHGVFWREALNHIGSPRSHGCIRLLPDDANFMFDFTDVGTEVKVVW